MSVTSRAALWFGALVLVLCVDIPISIFMRPLTALDSIGFIPLALSVLVVIGIPFALKPAWRPELGSTFGWLLATFAWFGALSKDTSTAQGIHDSAMMMVAVAMLALSYAICLRPLAERQRQAVETERLRTVLSEELAAHDGRRDRFKGTHAPRSIRYLQR